MVCSPGPQLSYSYAQIFLYSLVFFVAVTVTFTAVICKLCAAPGKGVAPGNQLAVHKLARRVALKRQVTAAVGASRWWERVTCGSHNSELSRFTKF